MLGNSGNAETAKKLVFAISMFDDFLWLCRLRLRNAQQAESEKHRDFASFYKKCDFRWIWSLSEYKLT